ncbi:hypothetical protein HBI80_171620 [Parastagonospora nodorum]|nr:hypothetical protein HBH49_242030 [Parastagonospora nodorum]KAH4899048.1 hypothetical protein HBI80_171620 [Parastagonospora nodorum]KAH4962368.1 hypothetical protein HBI78_134460 [Parastagonospora nodorum]KAH5299513.1 hypothetical protein HBI11_152950 [Parastagonospora nodorum]KAH5341825.1 hypothetical protein HBI33_235440 [Parastagonospora nodorum]
MVQPTVMEDLVLQLTAFLTGWRGFPDELKAQILGHILPAGHLFDHRDFTLAGQFDELRAIQYHKHVLPLISISELAGLVTEVFYAKNFMDIELVGHWSEACSAIRPTEILPSKHDLRVKGLSPSSQLLYPQMQARSYARHLVIKITRFAPETINFLQCLMSDDLDMNKLHSAVLIFAYCRLDRGQMIDLLASLAPIEFPTRKLEITSHRDYNGFLWGHPPGASAIVPDVLEMPLLEKLIIRSNGGKFLERLNRIHTLKGKPSTVQAWPTADFAKRQRVTQKVVKIK